MDVLAYILAKNKAQGYTDAALAQFGMGFTYKGSVETVEDLPTTATKGDSYNVIDKGVYAWNGEEWVNIGTPGPQGEKGEQGNPGRDGAIQYTAGTGIEITEDNVINNTQTSAEWGNITGDLEDQTDLNNALEGLADQIDNLKNLGKFLAIWNAATGLPTTEPPRGTPFDYSVGDYFRVGNVAAEGGTNYKPNGTQYTGDASTTVETEEVTTGAVYYYDGTNWAMQAAGAGGTVQDVQVDGVSVLQSGIANIPEADGDNLGVVSETYISDTAEGAVSDHDEDTSAHSDIREAVSGKYTKPESGIPKTDLTSDVQTSLGKADTAYQKATSGIPKTDLASAVQTSLGKADAAYQKASSGIPKTDLASAVQTSLGKADTAYQKATTGIPATDLAEEYITGERAQTLTDAEKLQARTNIGTGVRITDTTDPQGDVEMVDMEAVEMVETISSTSTHDDVATAKAVYDAIIAAKPQIIYHN